MTIKAFIFDLDGVITDTAEYHYQSWKRLAGEEGIAFTRADNDQLRGVSRHESLNRMLKGRPIDETTAQDWMARKNRYYLEFLRQLTPEDCLPGVAKFLDGARSLNFKLGIGSASRNAHVVLEQLQLKEEFDAIGDGYSVANTKPAPDLFIWVAGGLRVHVDETVVFEDAEAGIEAALNGGFWAVGIGSAAVHNAHLVLPDGLKEVTVAEVLDRLQREGN